MEPDEVRGLLGAQDAAGEPPRVRAVLLRRLGLAGAEPWGCLGADGAWYAVKFQNCPQEQRRAGRPLRVLPADLICGRLGRLFDPPLCPEVAVLDVSPRVVGDARHRRTRSCPPVPVAPGPSFGSRVVDGSVDTKWDAAGLGTVSLAAVARLAVFHAWLHNVDVSYLTTPDGGLLSIDHGYCLSALDGGEGATGGTRIEIRVPSGLGVARQRAMADPALFAPSLAELAELPAPRIVAAFAGLPPEWGLSAGLRFRLAGDLLRRRAGLPRAVATFCRRWGRAPGAARSPASSADRVAALVRECQELVPALQACLELADRGADICAASVAAQMHGRSSPLRALERRGLLEQTRVTRGGHRAYYALRDGPGLRAAVLDLVAPAGR